MKPERLKQISKQGRINSILRCVQDIEPLTASYIQKTFEVGFPFAKEVFDIEMSRRKARQARNDGRIELHLHTKFTALGSTCSIEECCAQAKEQGANAIAITDYGSVQSFISASTIGKQLGMKVIYGCEFLACFPSGTHRVTVLARNQKGLHHLYRLVTEVLTGNVVEHDYFLPLVRIQKGQEDLLFGLSTCDRRIVQLAERDDGDSLWELFSLFDYVEVNPPSHYDSVWFKGSEGHENIISKIVATAIEAGIPVIASADVNAISGLNSHVTKALAFAREKLTKGRSIYAQLGLQPYRPYRSEGEMLSAFSFLDEEKANRIVLDEPFLLAESIQDIQPVPAEKEIIPLIQGAELKIRKICNDRLEQLFEKVPATYDRRLEEELGYVHQSHFESIFLTYHLIANKAREDGRLFMASGTACNSLVAYLLGITDIDPLEHGLPIETSFGMNGEREPHVGLRFSADYLSDIQSYLKDLFGENNVLRAGTVEVIRSNTASLLAKGYLDEKCFEKNPSLDQKTIANRLKGVKRASGQQAGGFVVLPKGKRWDEYTPIQYPADFIDMHWKTTHLPYGELKGSLAKLDLMGTGPLTRLEELLIRTQTTLGEIDLHDPVLLEIVSGKHPEVTTQGLPEFSSCLCRDLVSVTNPTTLSDLIKILGLVRGGNAYLFYKEKFLNGDIRPSDDLVSNRDDLFLLLLERGIRRTDALRITECVDERKGLTEEDTEEMAKHGIPPIYIDACKSVYNLPTKYQMIEYLRIELALAYFKLHYPEEFDEPR